MSNRTPQRCIPARTRSVGERSGVEGSVWTTNIQLRARGRQLEGKHGARGLALGYERLEDGRRVVIGDGLEAHAQQTVGGKVGALEAGRVRRRGA